MHFTWGFVNDALYNTQWRRISNLTPRFYVESKGKAGQRFFTLLTEELKGARDRCWNGKRPMVFIATVLIKIPEVKRSQDIRSRLLSRMYQCTDGFICALIDYTCGAAPGKSASRMLRSKCPPPMIKPPRPFVLGRGWYRPQIEDKEVWCTPTAYTPSPTR